ncbi:hypothetical protein ACFFX1_18855 [Dactylosporangium sucinum]|uniref:Uncharacterized protein n=1 Tax=Dactylosporangium sucinum TaxID=1424081 RepID=A0A917TZN7_9ACTN|nr:hypothetical protein [Dactylosporangium sucinum]GGM46771.1 hypothetical protein GCM10007977_055590 [Dactylosporangium sucinum]
MTRRHRWSIVALVLAVTGGAAPASAHAPSPVVQVQPAKDRYTVRLTGWPPGAVTVAVCTDRPDGGCADATAVQAGVGPDGTAAATLPAAAPATGCPCVVRVRTLTGALTRAAPIALSAPAVAGARPADVPRPLAIARVTVHGGWRWAALFGGPVRRDVTLTVRNTGPIAIPATTVTVTAGRGEHPTGLVAAPALGPLDPGASVTYTVPVRFAGPAAGTYTVHGELDPNGPLGPAGATVAFHAETTTQPWGLTALLFAVALAAAVRSRRSRGQAQG